MRLRAKPQADTVGPLGRWQGAVAKESLCQRKSGAPDRATFLPVVARSLLVCALIGGGLAAGFLARDEMPDGQGTARALVAVTPQFMPRSSAQVASLVPLVPRRGPNAPRADAADRVDRVPYEVLLQQVIAAVGPRNPDELLEFGPMRVRRGIVETILKAAQKTETDPVLLMAIADKESSFSVGVEARTSSATGLYQFIDRTWLLVVRDFGAKHGLAREAEAIGWEDDEPVVADSAERKRILALRRDPYLSAVLAAEMLKRDAARIGERIGRELSHGETYIAHFLGPDDAELFLSKMVDEPKAAAAKLLPKPARANRPIFFARSGRKARGLSVAEVHEKFEAMMGKRSDRYRNVQDVAGAAAFTDLLQD